MGSDKKDQQLKSDAMIDGGGLDCGSGLLLMIRNAMEPINSGGILEVRSRESSVKEDLPAWCRMVGHTLIANQPAASNYIHYFVRKKSDARDDDLAQDLESAKQYVWRTRVTWQEGMLSKAFSRNHTFSIGQPASFNTEDVAPSALEHLLAALGGCLSSGFAWRLSRAGVTVNNLEVTLQAHAGNILVFLGLENDGNPGFQKIEGKVYIDADCEDETELERQWQETLQRSPVLQTLTQGSKVEIELMRV